MDRISIVGGVGFIGSTLATHLSKSIVIKILDIKPMPKDLEGARAYTMTEM